MDLEKNDCNVDEAVPDAEYARGNAGLEKDAIAALKYMDLEKNTPMTDIKIDSLLARAPMLGWVI